ncbi:neocarzinostatin apoprotein domain-containing protein [Spirillospora sp. NPDC047279]|uniref:neocarzinostatin apoprotein domain-containing protein n=1 Tax=Spirillospora sp. NPDC047279 TaxID=3155478 RepID=UPI0033D14EE4
MRHALSRRAGAIGALAILAAVPMATAADAAAPSLKVSKTTGLKSGDKITVSASGFTKDGQGPLGLCKPPAAGLDDCELSAPNAYMGTISGGKWSYQGKTSVQVTIKSEVKGVDCTSKAGACVVAVTMLGGSAADRAANTKIVPLTIVTGTGGGDDDGGDGGDDGGTGTDGSGTGTDNNGDLPNTGSPDGVPTYALVASALVLGGGAALLIIPRRRRRES